MVPYEISFILDERRVQIPFLSTPEEANAIYQALEADFNASKTVEVGDLQVYAPGNSPDSAEQILTTIEHECHHEEDDQSQEPGQFTKLMTMANGLDERARVAERTEVCLVEFIWDVGGGDDNAYASQFRVASDEPEEETENFLAELESFLETHGYAYDVGMTRGLTPPTQQAHEAVQDLVRDLRKETKMPQTTALLDSGVLTKAPAKAPGRARKNP